MQKIRQKVGVGPEGYVDDERAGYYEIGETYEVDDAKAQALLKTGKYELVDENAPSTWDGQVPEEPAPSDEPPAVTEEAVQAPKKGRTRALALPAEEPTPTTTTPTSRRPRRLRPLRTRRPEPWQ